ncbi:MAG: alpha/beta hydrolase [Microcystaceae cyanobacterium]
MKLNPFVFFPVISLMLVTGGQAAKAADAIVLKYSIFQGSIPVEDLSHLAETGEASPTLKSYLKLANQTPNTLQSALNQGIDVDGVTLSQVLNSFVGNIILDQMTEVIQTPSKRASREALRGALVQSALDDNNVRVIEVLENYPTQELHVDGERLVEVYERIKGITDKIPLLSL